MSQTGFSFGSFAAPATTTAATTAPSKTLFGAPAMSAPVVPAAGGFSFGAAASTPAASNPLSGLTAGLKTGGSALTTGTVGGFAFGTQPAASTTTAAKGLSFGAPTVTAPTMGNAPPPAYPGTSTTIAPAATVSFGLLNSAASGGAASTGLKLGIQTTTATTTGLLFAAPTSTTAAVAPTTSAGAATAGFPLAAAASAPTTGVLSSTSATAGTQAASLSALPKSTAAASATTSTPAATTASTAAATITATTAAVTSTSNLPAMTYKELETQMNKWWVELEAQEKIFLEQATKVNAWDRVLVENGDKITSLNSDVDRVKMDQQRLNHELDFIVAQQKELEEMLAPLESEMEKLPPINYHQHTDTEREHTYQMAENIDSQLKRMTEDLKEVIDHLNTGASGQDSNDPMLQISKILNAHMDSLQWIDQNTAQLHRRTEEISRYSDSMKREHERNFRLAYN